MDTTYDLRRLPPAQLLADLARLLARDCQQRAELLAHLAEVDARKLYLEQACSSMFSYCVERLHMAEPTAYKRIEAGRLARRFPVIFQMVADGRLHLCALVLLAPRLTEDNHRELLGAAVHKSKREIERLLAVRFPRAELPPDCRKVPRRHPATAPAPSPAPPPESPSPPPAPPPTAASASPAATPAAPPAAPVTMTSADLAPAPTSAPQAAFTLSSPEPPRPQLAPLSADRYYLKLTISAGVHDKLFAAQALLRHAVPSGDLDVVLGRALDALLGELRRSKFAQTAAPRPNPTPARQDSRHIPAEVKRQVVARDGYQCTFVDQSGRRCQERARLEFHHLQPFACGGASDAATLTLRCRPHNLYAAAKDFGEEWMRHKVQSSARAGPGSS